MSAPSYKQDQRLLSITTPLGKDVLLLAGFTGTEAISRLFSFQLEMYSKKGDLAAKDIVGKNVTWSVKHHDQKPRHFNGFVSRFSSGGKTIQDLYHYTAEVVPWLWFLTRTANCRMFQKMKLPDIIQKVFKDYGFTDYKPDFKATYRTWEYCVQYRETAFNFVSRLMEQCGIFYYFTHEEGKHTMVLADHKGTHKDVVENKVEYSGGDTGANQLSRWAHNYEFRPGKWAHTDYNFEIPSTSLLANTNTVVKQPGADKFEVFDYPGEYPLKADGDAEVKVRMEEDEAPYDVVSGGGNLVTFTSGGKFTIEKHDVASEKGKNYVLTSVQHAATDISYGTKGGGQSAYDNSFTAIPDSVTFRPQRLTPKPTVVGTQPAVVVGPKGQELYTDKYGRVKVHFFWDRESKRDENSSCWIRVAQVMAGKRWGASFWPRIGQEVLVAFLEGDPDRPIIVGSVYNAEQMPPYQGDGPDDKHKSDNKVSGYKSNTTMEGQGYNEWRFDDTKDKQQIFVHAEKDMDERVKNDRREFVGNDRHVNVKRHQEEHIEGNYRLTVGKGKASGGGTVEVMLEKDLKELIEGEANTHVKKDQKEKVDGAKSVTVGGDLNAKAGKNVGLEAGQAMHIKATQAIVIESTMQISLKVGGNFVDISTTGVAVNGMPSVMINSGGAAGSGAGVSPAAPTDATKAEPKEADDSKTGQKSAP